VVNQSLVIRITFLVKIATFAKPETVSRHPKKKADIAKIND